jgi:hypothetical protein
VVQGRESILKRARAFAKKHRETNDSVWLPVPNAFGQLVGYANAFCGIKLPICPETEQTLIALLENPGLILDRIPPQQAWPQTATVVETLKCLKPFPSNPNATLIRKFLGEYSPTSPTSEARYSITRTLDCLEGVVLALWINKHARVQPLNQPTAL